MVFILVINSTLYLDIFSKWTNLASKLFNFCYNLFSLCKFFVSEKIDEKFQIKDIQNYTVK